MAWIPEAGIVSSMLDDDIWSDDHNVQREEDASGGSELSDSGLLVDDTTTVKWQRLHPSFLVRLKLMFHNNRVMTQYLMNKYFEVK